MAVVKSKLVLIGGEDADTSKKTNKLCVWNETWTYPFPPMTTACCSPAVVTHNKWLVVIGGYGESDEGKLSEVQILDTIKKNGTLAYHYPSHIMLGH